MRQRGFLIGAALQYIIGAVVILGLIGSIIWWADRNIATSAGVKKGEANKEAEYAKRDAKALREAIAAKDKAEKEKAAAEKLNADLVAAASTDYQKGLSDGKKNVAVAIARVHAGYGLRDPGRSAEPAECPASGSAPPGPGTSGRDGAKGAKLSDQSATFLLSLAGEADEVVRQLTACQGVVSADRRVR